MQKKLNLKSLKKCHSEHVILIILILLTNFIIFITHDIHTYLCMIILPDYTPIHHRNVLNVLQYLICGVL